MAKSTMLMEYEDFKETERLQEFISSEGFVHKVETLQENAELDSKSNNILSNSILNESQGNFLKESFDENITYVVQDNKFKSENIKNALKYIFNVNNSIQIDSFYNDIEEWHGVVESIDYKTDRFKVLFSDGNGDAKFIVEFDIDDMQFASDKTLLKIGANIVWIFGHETKLIKCEDMYKPGPRTNISRLTIRRTKTLTKKQIKEAEENAKYWTEFFRRCKPED